MRKSKQICSIVILSLFILFTFYPVNAQVSKDQIKIIHADFDINYGVNIVPFDALTSNYDGIIIPFDLDTSEVTEKTCISISWSSKAIDGGYSIEINPKQIYLRSHHDNPNPNHLYWLDSLSNEQYQIIKSCLNSKIKNKFNKYTHKFSYSQSYGYKDFIQEKYLRGDWEDRSYDNLSKLLNLLNKSLKEAKLEVKVPSRKDFENTKPLLISYSEHELEEYLNQKERRR
jgi:hypothetical protein